MSNFIDYLYRYSLHDCKLDDIICERDKLIFVFSTGIYELDTNAKQVQLTGKCKMEIEFDNQYSENMYNHIDVNQILNGKIRDVDFEIFRKNLKNNYFDIDDNYYSRFCNTILLSGYIKKAKYEIKMSEISNINFILNP